LHILSLQSVTYDLNEVIHLHTDLIADLWAFSLSAICAWQVHAGVRHAAKGQHLAGAVTWREQTMLAQAAAALTFHVAWRYLATHSGWAFSSAPVDCARATSHSSAATTALLVSELAAVACFLLLALPVVSRYGWHHGGEQHRHASQQPAGTAHSGARTGPTAAQPLHEGAATACTLILLAFVVSLGVMLWGVSLQMQCSGLAVLLSFSLEHSRVGLMVFWAAVLACVLPFVHVAKKRRRSSEVLLATLDPAGLPAQVPKIVVRKAFHAVAVVMFLPAIIVDVGFTAVACGGALLLLLAVDCLRAVRARRIFCGWCLGKRTFLAAPWLSGRS
jgi:hypothetical protein